MKSTYVEDVESDVIRNNSYSLSRLNFPSGHLKKKVFHICLRTFAPKSSYVEIFFISPLELFHKVRTPKMEKKNGGHRLCFGENGSGKMP